MFGHRPALDSKSPVFRSTQLAVTVFAITFSIIAFDEAAPVVVMRYAVFIAFAVQIWIEFTERNCMFLKSPVFLLGFAAGTGFSLIPSFGYFLALQGIVPRFNFEGNPNVMPHPRILHYFAHTAEFYVIAFSMAALSVYGAIRLATSATSTNIVAPIPISARTENVLALASAILTASTALILFADVSPTSASRFVVDAYPPLQAFLLLVLLHQYLTKGANGLCLVILSVAVIAYYIVAHQAKAPLFLLVSMSFYYAYMRKLGLSRMLQFAVASIVFIFILVQVAQAVRVEYVSIIRSGGLDLGMAADVFASKVIWRQADTGNCLRNVIEKHKADDPMEGDHLFWIRGLVPRVFLPQKESLSLGSKYAIAYCGSPVETAHSASITLLGQPIVRTGIGGMLIHTGVLLVALGGLTWIAIRHRGLGTVSVMALLPWWIDFDQDFALYVANLVKFFLLMCLILLPLLWLGRTGTSKSHGTTDTSSRATD